jgi:DNA invertase Pin-like site-specific DNA recombinase
MKLSKRDVVFVTSLDRIAGTLFELLINLKRISAGGCQFRSLAEPWIDSPSSTGALALTVLEALANLDRNFKRIAAENGRFESKSKGTNLGRSSKLTASQRQEVIARREAGESPAAIASSYGVSRTTVRRLLRQR